MPPISCNRRRSDRLSVRAGFTLLEMLVVLALIALSAAIALPRMGAAIDQALAHTVFFDFQRQVLDLRRQAFHDESPLSMVSSGEFVDDPDADPPLAEVQLRAGWTYRLSESMLIDGGGNCTAVEVDLFDEGKPVMHLEGAGANCRFHRVMR